jgi:hypothetical protein
VGDEASLDSFVADDVFLRRVSKKRLIKDEVVLAAAFEDKHETLSFTLQNEELKTDLGLDTYQHAKVLDSGDLPGLIGLSFLDLTISVHPPLPPRRELDEDDERYGALHCCSNRPIDLGHREQLAKLATNNGIVRPFVPKKSAQKKHLSD